MIISSVVPLTLALINGRIQKTKAYIHITKKLIKLKYYYLVYLVFVFICGGFLRKSAGMTKLI
jgi:hypothetical protein